MARELKRLEADMYRHARNLEFEQAALVRDQIEELRQLELELSPGAASAYDTPARESAAGKSVKAV